MSRDEGCRERNERVPGGDFSTVIRKCHNARSTSQPAKAARAEVRGLYAKEGRGDFLAAALARRGTVHRLAPELESYQN
jgi:hypothetical protein